MTIDARKTLRVVFVCGAVIDGLAAVALLAPPLWPFVFGAAIAGGPGGIVAVGYAAALMAGWTALLAWCACAPLERAFVALLTAAPVIVGLIASELVATFGAGANAWRTLPLAAIQCVWVVILLASYLLARRRRDPA